MRRGTLAILFVVISLVLGSGMPALSADDTQVRGATRQVERGAHKIGDGKVGDGVEDLAKGIGNTVVEGAKFTGEKFKEAGKAAEPRTKSSWENVRDGAVSFGRGVRNFFARLFSS
jgi:hypothetical protein